MKSEVERFAWATCVCGKRAYLSRRAARRNAKTNHPEDSKLNAYRCPQDERHWHIGHLGPGGRDFHRREAS